MIKYSGVNDIEIPKDIFNNHKEVFENNPRVSIYQANGEYMCSVQGTDITFPATLKVLNKIAEEMATLMYKDTDNKLS